MQTCPLTVYPDVRSLTLAVIGTGNEDDLRTWETKKASSPLSPYTTEANIPGLKRSSPEGLDHRSSEVGYNRHDGSVVGVPVADHKVTRKGANLEVSYRVKRLGGYIRTLMGE